MSLFLLEHGIVCACIYLQEVWSAHGQLSTLEMLIRISLSITLPSQWHIGTDKAPSVWSRARVEQHWDSLLSLLLTRPVLLPMPR